MTTSPDTTPRVRHLIHVGYDMAGSAALQEWFSAHPEIDFAPYGFAGLRGVHDVIAHARDGFDSSRPSVTSFEAVVVPSARIRDNADSLGSGPAVRGRVREVMLSLFPDAHVLIVTRGFRAALFSLYFEAVQGGATSRLDEFARLQADLVQRDVSSLDYDAVIGEYFEEFGAERVTVLPVELLVARQLDFMSRLEALLGVSGAPVPVSRSQPSPSPWAICRTRAISRAIMSVPIGENVRDRLIARHVHRARRLREGRMAHALSRLPGLQLSAESIPAEALEAFRGRSTRLRAMPLYKDYAEEYLFDD